MRRVLLFLLLMFVFAPFIVSQNYPVHISTQVTPPVSPDLSEFESYPSRINTVVQLHDLTVDEYPVFLKLRIEGGGYLIESTSHVPVVEFTLLSGESLMLDGTQLAPLFYMENLEFKKGSRSEYYENGGLSEGHYKFSIIAYDINTGVRVSNEGFSYHRIGYQQPPEVFQPGSYETIQANSFNQVMFQWSHVQEHNPTYNLYIYEVNAPDDDPEAVVQYSEPIYVKRNISALAYQYSNADMPLEAGRDYVYRLRAVSSGGLALYRNNGYSEARKFTYGEPCLPPTSVHGESDGHNRASLTWQSNDNATGFNVRYRPTSNDESDWYYKSPMAEKADIENLDETTTYEYQVQSECGVFESDYTATKEFTTDAYDPPDFECGGEATDITITNTTPLDNLESGDEISAAGFDVVIGEIESSGTTYSGNGLAEIPYLHFIRVPVEFENIRINTDYELYSGEIETITDADSTFVGDIGDITDGEDDTDDTEDGDDVTDGAGEDSGDDFTPTDTISVEDTITDISVEDTVVIIEVDDSTFTEEIEDDEDIVISDGEGNSYEISDGEILPGPGGGETPGDGDSDEEPLGMVRFTPSSEASHSFGMDSLRYAAHENTGLYEELEIFGESYPVPWFSVESGHTLVVSAHIEPVDSSFHPDSVKFRTQSGTSLSVQSTSEEGVKQINVQVQGHEAEETVEAFIRRSDNTETQETVIGAMKIISYEETTNELVIVPLGDASTPASSRIEEQLNNIFSPSLASWNVTVEEPIDIPREEWDVKEENNKLDNVTSIFSNYSKEMRRINRYYEDARSTESDTYYLFLTDFPITGDVSGYMPFKKEFGFISAEEVSSADLPRVIAHELGHGTFRLYHTFSEKSDYPVDRGTTDNLMDYNNGKELHKYQWDYIHDPRSVYFSSLIDEEEAAMTWEFIDRKHTLLLNHIYAHNQIGNLEYAQKIEENSGQESINLDYSDEESDNWTNEQKQWIDQWDVGTYDGDDISESIIEKIQDADDGETIESITLEKNRVYIGKYNIDGDDYPIAVYSKKDELNDLKKIKGDDLSNIIEEEKNHYIYYDENFADYFIIAFYEEGDATPSLIIQVEQIDNIYLENSMEKWLEYLGVLVEGDNNPQTVSDTVKIYITRTHTGDNSTTGTLSTDDSTITGYTVELPRGTDNECQSICTDNTVPFDCHCITEGVYNFEINSKSYDAGNIKNYSLRILSAIPNGRTGVLIHGRRDDAKGWSQGCILPMPNVPKKDCKLYDQGRNNTKDQSVNFTKEILDWVRLREAEIKKRNKEIKKVEKQIIITKSF